MSQLHYAFKCCRIPQQFIDDIVSAVFGSRYPPSNSFPSHKQNVLVATMFAL